MNKRALPSHGGAFPGRDSGMSQDPGHVFVVHGDLITMACTDVIVPLDCSGLYTDPWRPLLKHLPATRVGNYWRLQDKLPPGKRCKQVPGAPGKQVPGAPGDARRTWLLDSGGIPGTEASWIADGLSEVLQAVAGRIAEDQSNAPPVTTDRIAEELSDVLPVVAAEPEQGSRVRPLVGLPLVGSGAGGFAGRRGTLITAILEELGSAVAKHGFDVVLVLYSRRDYAAVQHVRGKSKQGSWALDPSLSSAASELAARARSGELVLFLGAGVSVPAGLPTWPDMLERLGAACPQPITAEALSSLRPPEAATLLKKRLGGAEPLQHMLTQLFNVGRCSVGHALLAGLRTPAAVTTNYDRLYEIAAKVPMPDLAVLPYKSPTGTAPWLLKLHGDVSRPSEMVLTTEQYIEQQDLRGPLAAVVQTLLMTRHMLFLGYSLADDTFIRLATQVHRVMPERRVRGTVVGLLPDPFREELWDGALRSLDMGAEGEEIPVAARRLEIWLDLLAHEACVEHDFLLDPAYRDLLNHEECALRDLLQPLVGRVQGQKGPVADLLMVTLLALGATPPKSPTTAPPDACHPVPDQRVQSPRDAHEPWRVGVNAESSTPEPRVPF
jgi:hypothetical protein